MSSALNRQATFAVAATFAEVGHDGRVVERALDDAHHAWEFDDDETESNSYEEDDDDESSDDATRELPNVSALLRASATSAVSRSAKELAVRVRNDLAARFQPVAGFQYQPSQPSHAWSDGRPLAIVDLCDLCDAAATVLASEPSLLELSAPVYVLGDLHGNFVDLQFFERSLWRLGPELSPSSFLFLGDFVDRGPHSVELAAYLLSLKITNPRTVFLLQGNHESEAVNGDVDHYGAAGSFRAQCAALYGDQGDAVWTAMNAAFRQMPIAATIDKRIFCVHGGVPRAVATTPAGALLPKIRALTRPFEPSQLVTDLLWSDPAEPDAELGGDGFPAGFGPSSRGEDVAVFGESAAAEFFSKTGTTHLVRAHQPPTLGVQLSRHARVITIFSSSHYCGGFNSAAALLVARKRLQIIVSQIDRANVPGAGTVVAGQPTSAVPAPQSRSTMTVGRYGTVGDTMIDAAFAARDHTLRAARSAAGLARQSGDMTLESASRCLSEWSARLPRPVRALTNDAIGGAGLHDDERSSSSSPPPPPPPPEQELERASSFSALLPALAAPTLRRSQSVVSHNELTRFVNDAEGIVRQNDWQLRQAFTRADKDGSGFVERRELATALRAVGRDLPSAARLDALLQALGDGPQRLSFDEFRQLVGQEQDFADARRFVPALFAQLDRGQRGALSADDLELLASEALLPLVRRCLPVLSVLSRRDAVLQALRALPAPVSLAAFGDVMAAQLAQAQQREAQVRREFQQLAGKAGAIDYDQFVSLLDMVEQLDAQQSAAGDDDDDERARKRKR